MNAIVSFRLCTLSDEELLCKVDKATDEMFQNQKIPTRHIPAKPDEDYDLLVGELIKRFQEKVIKRPAKMRSGKAKVYYISSDDDIEAVELKVLARVTFDEQSDKVDSVQRQDIMTTAAGIEPEPAGQPEKKDDVYVEDEGSKMLKDAFAKVRELANKTEAAGQEQEEFIFDCYDKKGKHVGIERLKDNKWEWRYFELDPMNGERWCIGVMESTYLKRVLRKQQKP